MRRTLSLLVSVALLTGLCACKKNADPSPSGESLPTPDVAATAPAQFTFTTENFPRLDGSLAVEPFGEALASVLIGQSRAEGKTLIQFHKTDPAYHNLVDGAADLLLAAEPSQDACNYRDQHGQHWRMEPIAQEALVFVVNAANPVDNLSAQQIREIYAGQITNWSQVGGMQTVMQACQRPKGSGSQSIMEKVVMDGLSLMEPANLEYVLTDDGFQPALRAWDNQANMLYYTTYYAASRLSTADGWKILSVDGVTPNETTIRAGEYPFLSSYYAVMDSSMPANAPASILFSWLLSQEGQDLLSQEGYLSVQIPSGGEHTEKEKSP